MALDHRIVDSARSNSKETLEIFEPDAIPKMSGHQITISGSLSCYGQIYFTQTLSGFSFANWNLQGQGQGALA